MAATLLQVNRLVEVVRDGNLVGRRDVLLTEAAHVYVHLLQQELPAIQTSIGLVH